MTQPNTPTDIEAIVAEFLKLEEPAKLFSPDALIINSPRAETWLRTTLHKELQKAREEMEAMVRQILSDTVPDEESEYVNVLNIKSIAQAHGITIN